MVQSESQIVVKDLCKLYHIPIRKEGVVETIKSLFHREFRDTLAVDHISFSIQKGEVVGFIGPNGAGKTTTLKMLSGLLHPSSGEIRVESYIPHERKAAYLRSISMIMGNKNNLTWENTIKDCLEIQAAIYRVPRHEYQQMLEELVELLDIEALLPKMVRNLSLGERMKCELAAALLYRPGVLFLDEPTLGLDITMQIRLRQFLCTYNQRQGATMLLTSHYMADVTSLCTRIILIHKGRLLYDGSLDGLARHVAPFKLVRLTLDEEIAENIERVLVSFGDDVHVVEKETHTCTLRVEQRRSPAVVSALLQDLAVVDVTVEDPPIEIVIDQVYREGVTV